MSAEARIWQLCILCQKQTEEVLVCPLVNRVTSRRKGVYTESISLACQFREISATPYPDIELPDEESMQKNRASWHTSYSQIYMSSALDHAKTVIIKDSPCKKNIPAESCSCCNMCIFCGDETNVDHSLQKVTFTQHINDRRHALGEK